jgi:hypothetical protein
MVGKMVDAMVEKRVYSKDIYLVEQRAMTMVVSMAAHLAGK